MAPASSRPDQSQLDKFKEAARQLETHDDQQRAGKLVKKVVVKDNVPGRRKSG